IRDKLKNEYNLALDEDSDIIILAALLDMGRATQTTTFSLTEAYEATLSKIIPNMEIKHDPNPYRGVTYQKICELLILNKVPPKQLPTIAKRQYTENVIKCVDFDTIFKSINQCLEPLNLKTHPSVKSITEATKELVNARYDAASE